MWTTYKVDIECAVRKDIWVTTRYGDEDNGDGDDCDGDEGVEDAGAGDDAGDGMVSVILEAAHLQRSGIRWPWMLVLYGVYTEGRSFGGQALTACQTIQAVT